MKSTVQQKNHAHKNNRIDIKNTPNIQTKNRYDMLVDHSNHNEKKDRRKKNNTCEKSKRVERRKTNNNKEVVYAINHINCDIPVDIGQETTNGLIDSGCNINLIAKDNYQHIARSAEQQKMYGQLHCHFKWNTMEIHI